MSADRIRELREGIIRDSYRLIGKMLSLESQGTPLHPLGQPELLWRVRSQEGQIGYPPEYLRLVESLDALSDEIEAEFEQEHGR